MVGIWVELLISHQPSLIEEKKGTVDNPWTVFIWTNQSKFFWNTLSPVSPCSSRIALRRDLVVLDCQPPSNRRMKVSPTSAILLPWRNTCDTGALTLSWECVTTVLPDCQSCLLEMALFICCSIFLKAWNPDDLDTIHDLGALCWNSGHLANCLHSYQSSNKCG